MKELVEGGELGRALNVDFAGEGNGDVAGKSGLLRRE